MFIHDVLSCTYRTGSGKDLIVNKNPVFPEITSVCDPEQVGSINSVANIIRTRTEDAVAFIHGVVFSFPGFFFNCECSLYSTQGNKNFPPCILKGPLTLFENR